MRVERHVQLVLSKNQFALYLDCRTSGLTKTFVVTNLDGSVTNLFDNGHRPYSSFACATNVMCGR